MAHPYAKFKDGGAARAVQFTKAYATGGRVQEFAVGGLAAATKRLKAAKLKAAEEAAIKKRAAAEDAAKLKAEELTQYSLEQGLTPKLKAAEDAAKLKAAEEAAIKKRAAAEDAAKLKAGKDPKKLKAEEDAAKRYAEVDEADAASGRSAAQGNAPRDASNLAATGAKNVPVSKKPAPPPPPAAVAPPPKSGLSVRQKIAAGIAAAGAAATGVLDAYRPTKDEAPTSGTAKAPTSGTAEPAPDSRELYRELHRGDAQRPASRAKPEKPAGVPLPKRAPAPVQTAPAEPVPDARERAASSTYNPADPEERSWKEGYWDRHSPQKRGGKVKRKK